MTEWVKFECKLNSLPVAGYGTGLDSGDSIKYRYGKESIRNFRGRILDDWPHPLILLPPYTDFRTWLNWPLVLVIYDPHVVPSEACERVRKIGRYPRAFLSKPVFKAQVYVSGKNSDRPYHLEFKRPIVDVEDITRALQALQVIQPHDRVRILFRGHLMQNWDLRWRFCTDGINALNTVSLHAAHHLLPAPSTQAAGHDDAGLKRDECITIMQKGLLAGLNSKQDL